MCLWWSRPQNHANYSTVENAHTHVRPMRPRSLTQTHPPSQDNAPGKINHARAASELLCSSTRINNLNSDEAKPPGRIIPSSCLERSVSESQDASTTSHAVFSHSSTLTAKPALKENSHSVTAGISNIEVHGKDGMTTPPKISERSRPPIPAQTTMTKSVLDIEDDRFGNAESVHTSRKASDITLQSVQDTTKELGVSFDDLVDRLLSQPMSKSSAKFAAIFFCLYRKFAAPSDLMSAIIHRFERLNHSEYPQILRISSQLRYLNLLAQWISGYPGDFGHVLARRSMASFISGLAGNRVFAVASKEMSFHLEVVSEDDDTEWECSDNSRSRSSTKENSISKPRVQNISSTHNPNGDTEDIVGDSNPEQGTKCHSTRGSATPSTSSSADRSASQSTGSFQTLLNSTENAQRQARLLTPIPKNSLTKIQWHQLMDMSNDEVAHELTRIDWILFSSIRPRDLIRHVTLAADQKEKCKSLENVNRMINQFNHVAFWVANMILLRNKAKHRAKALEKFMGVAWVSQM